MAKGDCTMMLHKDWISRGDWAEEKWNLRAKTCWLLGRTNMQRML